MTKKFGTKLKCPLFPKCYLEISFIDLRIRVIFLDISDCNKNYFTCGHDITQCIPLQWVCDVDPECRNGRDKSEDLCKNAGACGGNFTDANGILYSPSYPDNYPDNSDCIYTISQPGGNVILLNFLSMDSMGFIGECEFDDYLEIRDGPSAHSPLLGKLCGSEIPAPIQSSQNQLWMK